MIRRSKLVSQSLPAGPWSAEQMFETIQRVTSAQAAGQISTGDANRYLMTLLQELEGQQSTRLRLFARNSPLIFRNMSFDNLLMQDARLVDAYFSLCTFTGSNLAGSQFTRCTFSDCSFEQVDFRDASFVKCNVNGCIFRGALLDHTSFRTSVLTRCDFEN